MIARERNIRSLQLAGAVLAVMFGIWAGIRVYSNSAFLGAADRAKSVKVAVGEASPPSQSDFGPAFDAGGLAPSVIPDRLPDFTLSDRSGKATPIAAWAGKSLILNFWATWCAPCRREIPLLESLSGEWSARGVQVIGVAVDYRDKVNAFADELKITYPLLLGEQDALDVAAQLGVASPVFPFTVFTDRHGDVVALYIGELHRPQADLILSVVQTVNDDRMKLPEARRSIADGLRALAAG
jgi:peroxiredoxin